jgi:putative nucleotidyltransferase-like protein
VSTTISSNGSDPLSTGWVSAALELLSWSVHRPSLDEPSTRKLKASTETFIATLKEKQLDSLFYMSCSPGAAAQSLYDKVWAVQKEILLQLGRSFSDEGIGFYLFKGSESVERWYGSRALGFFNDVDLLVGRADLGSIKAILYGNGFRQARFDQAESRLVDLDVLEIALLEGEHYELAPFRRLVPIHLDDADLRELSSAPPSPLVFVGDEAMVMVELDIHHSVATDIDAKDVMDDAQTSALGLGLSLSDTNQLWLLTSRYYTEVALHGKTSLRDFCYLLPIIGSGTIDWNVVLRAANKYQLRASLFYFLSFMSSLAGGAVPADVLSELSPLKGTRMRDWGWQLGKLFSFVEDFPFAKVLEMHQRARAEAGH